VKNRGWLLWSLLILGADSGFRPALASHARETLPWSASFEVMGRAVLYGVALERAISRHGALGVALSKAEAQSTDNLANAATLLIPVSYYFYFSEQESSLFSSAGLTFVSNSAEVGGRSAILGTLRYPSFPLMAHAALGWEIRQVNGFLFRVQGLVTRASSTSISSGFNLGFAF
jgi:hypothetical protein